MTKLNSIFELWDSEITKKNVQLELDQLTELARILFDSSLAIFHLKAKGKPWFVSKKIDDTDEIKLEKLFSTLVLDNPNEILIIEDTRSSELQIFKDFPEISFFAGAPLVSHNGRIIGTISVIDNIPRKVSLEQIKCLKIIARKITDFLNLRRLITEQSKIIVQNSYLFEKLTESIPEIVFQMTISENGQPNLSYMSKDLSSIHPDLSFDKLIHKSKVIEGIIYPDDLDSIVDKLSNAIAEKERFDITFRIVDKIKGMRWFNFTADPHASLDTETLWFGVIQDITEQKNHEQTLDQISFDISHVLRRPVSSMLGLTRMLEKEDLDEETLRTYAKLIGRVADELNEFTKNLNQVYHRKRFSDS